MVYFTYPFGLNNTKWWANTYRPVFQHRAVFIVLSFHKCYILYVADLLVIMAQKEVDQMSNIFITLLISVIAGIIANYLYDWLAEKKNGNEEN